MSACFDASIMFPWIIGLYSLFGLQNKEPTHTKGEAGQALIQSAVAHAGGNRKLQM